MTVEPGSRPSIDEKRFLGLGSSENNMTNEEPLIYLNYPSNQEWQDGHYFFRINQELLNTIFFIKSDQIRIMAEQIFVKAAISATEVYSMSLL